LTPEEEAGILLAESLGFDFDFLRLPVRTKEKYKVTRKIEIKKEAIKVAAL